MCFDLGTELWAKKLSPQDFIKEYYNVFDANRVGYAIISLKLKRFELVNRILGRKAGNEILGKVYDVLQELLGEGECVTRFYSDYFNVLMHFTSIEDIHKRAVEMVYAIRDIPCTGVNGKLFAGIGIYRMFTTHEDFYIAQYKADACRKGSLQSKYRNSHYEIYDYSYFDSRELFLDLEQSVNAAVEANEFKLYVQPKVNLRTGKVDAAEALVRWNNPKRGLLSPIDFLPGMEENGCIRKLDLYLFNVACKYLEHWQKDYSKKIQISFNISNAYFGDNDFMPDYSKVFERYNVDSDCIQFELLESIVLDRVERVCKVVDEIRASGFTCAIDDFGSGFSAFGVLTSAWLSVLKIDRSLFSDFDNEKERIVLKHIVNTAKDLGLKTVAEGVETQQYTEYLRQIGCDYVQGYVYYTPMPIDEFEQRFIVQNEKIDLT